MLLAPDLTKYISMHTTNTTIWFSSIMQEVKNFWRFGEAQLGVSVTHLGMLAVVLTWSPFGG